MYSSPPGFAKPGVGRDVDPRPTGPYNEAVTRTDPLETLLVSTDRALRALFATPTPVRPAPRASAASTALSPTEKAESARLMRVNHAGEVAAQALYHGQATFASDPEVRALLLRAAREEADHLAWCDQRLRELDSRPSLLGPLWYAGSFAIGAAAALVGDRISLGFVSETERQVEGHIDDHLARLPAADHDSRAVLEVMRADEIAHGAAAREAGAAPLPEPVQLAMRATSRVMTKTSYWL